MTLTLRPHLELLAPAEAAALHERSLALLREPGMPFCAAALERLAGHGCAVDRLRGTARISPDLVERALHAAPRTVRLAACRPEHDLALDAAGPHFALGGPRGPAPDEEVLRLAAALPEVELLHVGSDAGGLRPLAAGWQATGKHARLRVTRPALAPLILELADAVTAGQALTERGAVLSAAVCPDISAARDAGPARAALELAARGVPILLCPSPPPESPPNRAGTESRLSDVAAGMNAAFLASLVLYHCVRPGAPVIYGLALGPQAGPLSLLIAGLARSYGLPLSLPGLSTTAARLGPLAGWEGSGQAALAVLAGAAEVRGMGLLAADRALSAAKLVYDAEQARQLNRLARGTSAGDETLLAGVIERVGPHGHYLLEPETRRLMRAEVTPRQLRDERSPAEWLAAGRDEEPRLRVQVARLLAGCRPPDRPAGVSAAVEAILAAADRLPPGEGSPP